MPFYRCLLLLLVTVTFANAQHQVQTLSGTTISGKIVTIDEKEVQVEDKDGKIQKTPLVQVLAIDLHPAGMVAPDYKYVLVQLFESRLLCKDIGFKGNNIDLTLLSGQKATIPLTSVVGFIRDAQDAKMLEQFEQLSKAIVKKDRVLVLREGALNSIEGALGDVDAAGEKIQFRLESGNVIPVTLAKLQGAIFYRLKAPTKSPICVVHDTMGNKVAAVDVKVDGDTFEVTTPTGAKIAFAEKSLSKLDYNRGKLTFLSDMQPMETVEKSAIGLVIGLKHRKDTNLEGEPIVLASTEHSKGLSMHAHTELEYALNANYKEFKAVVGVDAKSKTESEAIVTILCDGLEVYKKKADAKNPDSISINVRNVQRLRIMVSSEGILNLHDHATLADARVTQ